MCRVGSGKKRAASTSRQKQWRRQVRSNLTKVISFLDGVELQNHHLALLQITPFYQFLLPFINKAINPKHIQGTKRGLVNILDSYDKNQQGFLIAGKKLTITVSKFEVILALHLRIAILT